MLVIQKNKEQRNAKQTITPTEEYRTIPVSELRESLTNPRKDFAEESLHELSESIKTKGLLSPLLVRSVAGQFEIVAGARRYRAAVLAGLAELPVCVRELGDAEAQELQVIENLQRADLHPFEEAEGFAALAGGKTGKYSIEQLAARIAKPASYLAKRLKLLDLTEPAAEAFRAGRIGIEHALLIAKLAPDAQENALTHCFDGYFAGNDGERSLVPVSRLQAWIEQNVYLNLKSVPFSKDDATLVPEAGSCTDCPKRTGFNTLLFPEAGEDACVDAACFNRKLDASIALRQKRMPDLVLISESYASQAETPVLSRRNYVEVVRRRGKRDKQTRPDERLCTHLKPAIYADGIDKGRLVKVCADKTCTVHFREQREEERRQLRQKAERAAQKREQKESLAFRHRLLAEVLKRVKPQLASDELRLVLRFVLASLPHELACRLAKRHGLGNAQETHDWQLAEKARTLWKKADESSLTTLLLETMLLGSAANGGEHKENDLLTLTASLYKVDARAILRRFRKEEKAKMPQNGAKLRRSAKRAAK